MVVFQSYHIYTIFQLHQQMKRQKLFWDARLQGNIKDDPPSIIGKYCIGLKMHIHMRMHIVEASYLGMLFC